MSLGRGSDTDIIAIAGLVKNETPSKHHSKTEDKHDGIGTWVRQPGLGKRMSGRIVRGRCAGGSGTTTGVRRKATTAA
jgi:hypothetical protein